MDSQEEYLFCKLRKKKYVYSLKGMTQTESVVCDERIV